MSTVRRWTPTLTYTESREFEVTFLSSESWQRDGVSLCFRVTPNVTNKKEMWEEKVISFLKERAAEMTGLEAEDFVHSQFIIEPGYLVATHKKPLKEILL